MRVKPFLIATVVVLSSAALAYPTEGAQRQRSPGGESRSGGGGGGHQGGGGGGGHQGGGARSRGAEGGGGGGAGQRQGGGERRAEPRGGNGNGNGNGGGRREAAAQPQTESRPPQAVPNSGDRRQTEARQQAGGTRQAQPRRVPDATTDLRRGTSEQRLDQGRVGEQPRVAVPRQGQSPDGRRNGNWNRNDGNRDRNDGNWNRNGYRVHSPRYRGYNNRYHNGYPYYGHARPYYYYPYSFGYGPRGRGFFYFDLHYNSYVFYPSTVVRYDNYGTYYGDYGYPTGELRLQVRPRDAQVFIDGGYAGTVDEFDGTFQSLRLEGGEYQVEIVLPGYEPLDFDVRITPGEKVTYKGDLLPEQQPQAFPEPPQP